ncbi:MAG: MarR family transcriptional regulator, partial [Acidimicrobiia bacterium]
MSREDALRRLTAAVRGAQAAGEALDEAFADFAGLNRTDTRCLDIIDQTGPLTAGELARRIGLS